MDEFSGFSSSFVIKEEPPNEEEVLQTEETDWQDIVKSEPGVDADGAVTEETTGNYSSTWHGVALKEEWIEDVKFELKEEEEALAEAEMVAAGEISCKEEPYFAEDYGELGVTLRELTPSSVEWRNREECGVKILSESQLEAKTQGKNRCHTLSSKQKQQKRKPCYQCYVASVLDKESTEGHSEQNSVTHLIERLPTKPHRRAHPFACDVCDFTSTRSTHLEGHVRIHKKTVYSCFVCRYACCKKKTIRAHVKSHVKKKPHACSVCKKSFATFKELSGHKNTHRLKTFLCDECDYITDRYSNLKTHVIRRHTVEKPFSCLRCKYTCSDTSMLKRHLAIHSDEKRYACGFCDYRCNRHDVLVNHMRIHTGERPFVCDLCDYATAQLTNLKMHKLKRHAN